MGYYKEADVVCEELLEQIDDKYAKEKGRWLWEIMKAVGCGISDLTAELDSIANGLYADRLSGDELDEYVGNWCNVVRKRAAQAGGYVTFYAYDDITIPSGLYVTNGNYSYITTESGEAKNGGSVTLPVICTEFCSGGNCESGEINALVTGFYGISAVTNEDAVTGGSDEESDTELLERYYAVVRRSANAGNAAFYVEKALEISGVGSAVCVPVEDGPGTVSIYITGTDGKAAGPELIERVQEYIDPNGNGEGEGIAPIGASVSVKAPETFDLSVSVFVYLYDGYNVNTVRDSVIKTVAEYAEEAQSEGIIRYNRIAKCVLDADGVKDYTALSINNMQKDIELGGVFVIEVTEVAVSA